MLHLDPFTNFVSLAQHKATHVPTCIFEIIFCRPQQIT